MHRIPLILTMATACVSSSKTGENTIDHVDVPWETERTMSASAPEPIVGNTDSAQEARRRPNAAPSGNSVALHSKNYHLTWNGKRIGEAKEIFHKSENGIRILRHENIRITRGGTPVKISTEITIQADARMRATRVELAASAGAVTRRGYAMRANNDQWIISLDGELVRRAPADAVPLELVPYLVAHNGSRTGYQGNVLLAGYGFAIATLKLDHHGDQGKAVLKTPWGNIATDLHMSIDGNLLRTATGSSGSIAVDERRVDEEFAPPELPQTSSIPLAGTGSELLLANTSRPPPPALDGQSVSLDNRDWRVRFPSNPAVLSPKVVRLVRHVDALIADAHDAPGASAADALRLGRGDCTAHATLFVDLAREQGFDARLVTGYHIENKQLVRHRWAAVRQGKRWIQVDPSFGEAPVAPGNHLALAVHDNNTAQITLVDEAVFQGFGNARAQWVPAKIARP